MFLGSIRQRLKAAVISPLFMRQKSSQTIMSADNGTGGGEEEEEGTYVEIGWQPTVWTEDALKLPDIKPKDRANLYFVNTLFGTGVQPMRRVNRNAHFLGFVVTICVENIGQSSCCE
jgi:hypothetical protein